MATPAPFGGFAPDAIRFLADLALNNNRAWFAPRKGEYARLLKEPMEALVAALAERFEARGLPLLADPRRSVFRIYRDTRFSRDKSPYKTNLAASFPWAGEGVAAGNPGSAGDPGSAGAGEPTGTAEGRHGLGAYFSFRPGEMYAGGGMWMPTKPRLDAFRRAVVDDPDRVRGALEEPGFVAWFGGAHSLESLKRIPPGYPPEHPLAELLRWKHVVFGRSLADDDVCSPGLPDILADGYAAALPVFRFLATLR